MLVFHSHCQMGNQMFIYACARSLAKKRKLDYCLSEIEYLKYFELSKDDINNASKYRKFKIINKIPGLKFTFKHYQDNRIDYADLMVQEKSKRVWYYGYFQGEKYLFDNTNDIRKCFQIKSQYVDEYNNFKNKYLQSKRSIVVHIRLKDYKTFGPDFLDGPDLTLPFNYYHHNLQHQISQQADSNFQVIFLSDDINEVKKEFGSYNGIFSENNMIVDFQILKNASVAIISPSSYAWWACWLSDPGKQITVVPKYFLGFKVKNEFPIHMIPPHFIQAVVN